MPRDSYNHEVMNRAPALRQGLGVSACNCFASSRSDLVTPKLGHPSYWLLKFCPQSSSAKAN